MECHQTRVFRNLFRPLAGNFPQTGDGDGDGGSGNRDHYWFHSIYHPIYDLY